MHVASGWLCVWWWWGGGGRVCVCVCVCVCEWGGDEGGGSACKVTTIHSEWIWMNETAMTSLYFDV